ncbi:hypothetical protein MYP_4211 [Sporocytophaga myxococcoides]|uniref:Uncharacterized protein n=1 Tax=Sporocytophaga myxococcoides TaxID=153721 RepID=A0A098LJ17_9BACT|nr:hypothetical protein MYP_4211 [Sporocytophaga myxococcoides]
MLLLHYLKKFKILNAFNEIRYYPFPFRYIKFPVCPTTNEKNLPLGRNDHSKGYDSMLFGRNGKQIFK